MHFTSAMHFTFELAQGYLRAELFGRQTAEETDKFVAALVAEARERSVTRFLVWVRNSRPMFRDEFRQLASQPGVRLALLADSDEVRASHQYIEVLAAQQGAGVRAFRDERRALDWLGAQSQE
jgi:hypothetical protein